ncbi:MAG: ATP-dependent zinc metalloprotease FtsH [Victivallales bacterium]|nr:ATP-dependent zinc metalloprotease FtsH [Victivallales bacterium]
MSRNNQAKSPENKPQQPENKNLQFGRQILLWILIFISVPLACYYFMKDGNGAPTQFIASQFDTYLAEGRIDSVTLEEQSSSHVQILSGQYWLVSGESKELRPYKVRVIYTDSLDQAIREHCPNRSVKAANGLFSSILVSVLPLVIMLALFYFLFLRQIRASNGAAFQFGKSRARLMSPSDEKITLKDVAGINEAKEEMQEVVDYLKDPKKFQKLGGKVPRGILMVGPPGTGKTLLGKAIAGEANVPFFSISGSDFVEMFVGVGASRVRDMFEEGKKHAPCMIFIDEIDAVGRSRFSGIGGGHDERVQTLNALLVEMDGFEPNSGVIVLAATNRPDVLDPALLRPGRFDRQIVIDLPDLNGRMEILKIHAKRYKIAKDVDLSHIARGTSGFSGADLANLLNEAAILATRKDKEAIDLGDMEEARDKVCWGKERRSRKMTSKQRRLTAYHEAGHTLVNMYCEHAEPLHKVTIIPRGMALGATMFLPETDRYNITENEAMDMMTMGMGGRCAEKLIFHELTSGASMDISQATEMARKMVCKWGMCPRLGALSYAGREEHIFLGRDITRSDDFSPETAREIDIEIRRLIDTAERRASDILETHIDQLKLLAETLLEKETMSSKEVYGLLGMKERKVETDEVIAPENQKTAEDDGRQLELNLPEKDDESDKGEDNKE